jgi:hypothetical protein
VADGLAKGFGFFIGIGHAFAGEDACDPVWFFPVDYRSEVDFFSCHQLIGFGIDSSGKVEIFFMGVLIWRLF